MKQELRSRVEGRLRRVAAVLAGGSARERKKKGDELLDVFARFGGVDARS